MGLSTDKLKAVLGANNQSRNGRKAELAERCADGSLLGRIPMCPQCGGGRLRFERRTGIYKCPGYMDDDEFKNCNRIYSMGEIERGAWQE